MKRLYVKTSGGAWINPINYTKEENEWINDDTPAVFCNNNETVLQSQVKTYGELKTKLK